MTATFNWTISTLERDLLPEDMNGAVVTSHWRVTAEQIDGDETYTATSYGTQGYTPDPSAEGYIAYDDLTEADVLGWLWAQSEDWKADMEASLQAQIDAKITPSQAAGVPWS